MDSDKQFEQLAQRDTELQALATRGRRRALLIMIIAFLPIPFVLIKINDDRSLAGMIPIAIACAVAISYSWTKWQRGPEDSQSVAFLGLTASGDGRPIAPCFAEAGSMTLSY